MAARNTDDEEARERFEIQTDLTDTTTKAKAGTARRQMRSTQMTWFWSVLLKDNDAEVFSSGRHQSTISRTRSHNV